MGKSKCRSTISEQIINDVQWLGCEEREREKLLLGEFFVVWSSLVVDYWVGNILKKYFPLLKSKKKFFFCYIGLVFCSFSISLYFQSHQIQKMWKTFSSNVFVNSKWSISACLNSQWRLSTVVQLWVLFLFLVFRS